MPEGLKVVVGADVKQAEQNLKNFVSTAQKAGTQAGQALSTGLNKVTPAIQKITDSTKPAMAAVSRLGENIETLRAKLLAKQQFLINERDIAKVAILNQEMQQLEQEILRVGRAGSQGFDQFGNVLAKTGGGFSAVASGAGTAFSALRKVAFLIPGIGIAGLVSLLSDAVVGLFKASDGLDKAAVSAAKFAVDIKEASEGVKQFVESLDFGSDIDKLNNKLRLGEGDALDLANFKVDKTKNDRIIQVANDEITELTDKILKIRADAAFVLSTKGQQLLQAFPIDLEIPNNLIDDLSKKDQAIINSILVDATRIKELEDQRLRAFEDNAKAEIEVQIKKKEDLKKAFDKLFDQTVTQAKRLAAFLDNNTQFSVNFEVDPLDTKGATFKKAQDFITKAKSFVEKQTPEFHFKPLLSVEFNLKFDKRILDNIRDQAGIEATKTFREVKKEFEENIKRLAESDPIIIQTNATLKAGLKQEDLRNSALASGTGIKLPELGPLGTPVLSNIDKQAITTAQTITGILTPAFQGLFSAIKSGEDPLKAFFTGIGQAVEQLIEKLIAAAVEALVLSAIFPGGFGSGAGAVKGFGGFFKNILGFAGGGLVSGPTLSLIGEGIGTNKSNPEVVAPLDQLKGLLGGIGGNNQQVIIMGRLRGNDIALQQNRNSRRNGRLGG